MLEVIFVCGLMFLVVGVCHWSAHIYNLNEQARHQNWVEFKSEVGVATDSSEESDEESDGTSSSDGEELSQPDLKNEFEIIN